MPEEIAGMMASVYVGEPVAFEVLLSIIEQKEKIQIDEIEVISESFVDGATIKETGFDELRLILLGVLRNAHINDAEFIFNPDDNFVLQAGDSLVCIGYVTAISNFKRNMQ
jgi:Trk K+ transport system NAD-binding subunit